MHKYVGILKIAALASAIAPIFSSCGKTCVPERIDSLPIPGSDWTVERWLAACGMGISGPIEIRAINSKKEAVIVAVIDAPANTSLSINGSNDLVITLPNLVDIRDEKQDFGEVKVVYNFQPRDDPDERAKFQRFIRNPNDPDAKKWYCDNVASKMDAANRVSWSKIVGCPQ
jgi:hypothetical protein